MLKYNDDDDDHCVRSMHGLNVIYFSAAGIRTTTTTEYATTTSSTYVLSVTIVREKWLYWHIRYILLTVTFQRTVQRMSHTHRAVCAVSPCLSVCSSVC